MGTVTKIGINAAKTDSKRVVLKIVDATGDLIRNKIADKITSWGKTKSKKKRRWNKLKARNLHITRKKTTNYWWLKLFLAPYKNGIPKN